jgi:hypothetical protein
MPAELYTYNGTKLADEVKRQFGDVGTVQITDTHILAWINNGQRSIASTNNFLELAFTTNILAGQGVYDLTALIAGARIKSYSSVTAYGRRLKFVPWSEWITMDLTSFDDDKPWVYTEYGSIITVAPAPNESVPNALTVYYEGWPADLAAIGDPLTIPDRFYNALVSYVFARALELDENFEAAQQQLEQHAAALSAEAGREASNPTDFYPTQGYEDPAYGYVWGRN